MRESRSLFLRHQPHHDLKDSYFPSDGVYGVVKWIDVVLKDVYSIEASQ